MTIYLREPSVLVFMISLIAALAFLAYLVLRKQAIVKGSGSKATLLFIVAIIAGLGILATCSIVFGTGVLYGFGW